MTTSPRSGHADQHRILGLLTKIHPALERVLGPHRARYRQGRFAAALSSIVVPPVPRIDFAANIVLGGGFNLSV
ncbi:hypothetical protein G3N57_01810 [Paraburkholderia sp. Se-20369]|nr:hypothetical protein [Paraburkholderia sp. Se-20369]